MASVMFRAKFFIRKFFPRRVRVRAPHFPPPTLAPMSTPATATPAAGPGRSGAPSTAAAAATPEEATLAATAARAVGDIVNSVRFFCLVACVRGPRPSFLVHGLSESRPCMCHPALDKKRRGTWGAVASAGSGRRPPHSLAGRRMRLGSGCRSLPPHASSLRSPSLSLSLLARSTSMWRTALTPLTRELFGERGWQGREREGNAATPAAAAAFFSDSLTHPRLPIPSTLPSYRTVLKSMQLTPDAAAALLKVRARGMKSGRERESAASKTKNDSKKTRTQFFPPLSPSARAPSPCTPTSKPGWTPTWPPLSWPPWKGRCGHRSEYCR